MESRSNFSDSTQHIQGKGLDIGISMSHLVADCISIALFLKSWTDITRGINLNISETRKFDASAVFAPQNNLMSRPLPRPLPEYSTKCDNVVIKRFIMSSQTIERLRKGDSDQTRAEAVSELTVRCLNRMRMDSNSMMITVNIRKKTVSSKLSDNSFEDLWINVDASGKERVRSVDEGYVRKRERSGWLSEGAQDSGWIFSGWCRIGLHRSGDFVWREPIWLVCGIRDMMDVCILMDTKDGNGIDG